MLARGGAPEQLVVAGLLHDLLEKTDVTVAELQQRFGARITQLVLAVTDDERISSYKERKAALRNQVANAGDEAVALFAADKLSKLRELGRRGSNGSARSQAQVLNGWLS